MAKDLNRVLLIGNITRDPDFRMTDKGSSSCRFTIATNRSWLSEGVRKEESEFTQCIAWGKLADLCAQLLKKGSHTYIEGRLSSHKFTDSTGLERLVTEVNIEDMILLDMTRGGE